MVPGGAETQRLFFALWPEPELGERLFALGGDRLRVGGRGVVAENLHLTLAFLGSLDVALRQRLEQGADGIRVPRFTLALDRVGCFRRKGIFWAGATQTPAPLLELVGALKAAQAACGLTPEDREYQVHVTLARDVRRCPPEGPITPSLEWPARRFVLVESHTDADGARYEILRSWELTTGTRGEARGARGEG